MGRSDDELGMNRPITRRDFLDGMAAGAGILALGAVGCGPSGGGDKDSGGTAATYPPSLTGMRGNTDVARVVPHSLRDGTFFKDAGDPESTGESYDLVVVGGGISGLAAARFYQQEFGQNARILILDAMDDVGGHARRNQFESDGHRLVGYGGSQSLDSPSAFSRPAKAMLEDLDIKLERFNRYYDSDFRARNGLGSSIFFDEETWGRDHMTTFKEGAGFDQVLKDAPMAPQAKIDLHRIIDKPEDWMPGMSDTEIKDRLAEITYMQYLEQYVKAHPDALKFLQTMPNGNWGYGADAVGALDASIEFPGFGGLNINWEKPDRRLAPTGLKTYFSEDDYIYHFPEGNGGVALSLVRKLIPPAFPGQGMQTIPTTDLRYDQLDSDSNRVRVRLNAPVVKVAHLGNPDSASEVQVDYRHDGKLRSVKGGHVVLACYNQMIPYLTDEISRRQREALQDAGKLAIVYTSVQIRNWEAFKRLKTAQIEYPTMYWAAAGLDFPVSMGEYKFPDKPGDPTVLHLSKAVCKPGLSPRDQGRAGRAELMTTSFRDMERSIRDQLGRALGPGGFDPAADIEAITVNRWAHGYAYEYGLPWDKFWPDGELPSHVARQKWGRIAVANTDSAPRAYADSAIDMAYRSVRDLAGKPSDEVSRGVDGEAS